MRSAREALAKYQAQHSNRPHYCLWEVQEAFGAPHRYPGAVGQPGQSSQWNNGDRVRNRDIPIGAPVYWYNPSGWGHIAIYAGNGMVRSSDAGGRGRMGTRSIDWITQHWYPTGRFLGWTRDIGGVRIDFDGGGGGHHAPEPHHEAHHGGGGGGKPFDWSKVEGVLGGGAVLAAPNTCMGYGNCWNGYTDQRARPFVKEIQKRLRTRGAGIGWGSLALDGIYGPDTQDKVYHFQKHVWGVNPGPCGRKTWDALWSVPIK